MNKEKKYRLIIAESSPVISYGFATCLKKLSGFQFNISELTSYQELVSAIRKEKIDFLLVNPTFGGAMNPSKLREESLNGNIRLVAIELGKLNRQASELYDGIIHVTDDVETIRTKLKTLCNDNEEPAEEKEPLSLREKEIISLVVKGMTNQEIADKLFLSIHTVITHRRNIAKKLEIHSATGLTIYAIVNKIVEINDISLQ